MGYTPNEILCQQISYITNVNDIVRLRQINPQFKELSEYCITHIHGNYIPLNLVLTLKSLKYIDGIVKIYDISSLISLSVHPSLRNVTIQYIPNITDVPDWRIGEFVAEKQFEALSIVVHNKHNLNRFNISVLFPEEWESREMSFQRVGIIDSVMYIESSTSDPRPRAEYFIREQTNLFKDLNVRTLITDNDVMISTDYQLDDFMTSIEHIQLCWNPILHRDENDDIYGIFRSIVNLSLLGKLKYFALTLPENGLNVDEERILYTWIWDNLRVSAINIIPINNAVYLDVPFYPYLNTIDLVLSIFKNIPIIGLSYTNQPNIISHTLNRLLSRSDITIIKLYTNIQVELGSEYLNNPKIQIHPYSQCELDRYYTYSQ